jgi:hypothetical protein
MNRLRLTPILATVWLFLGITAGAQEVVIQEKPVRIVTSSSPEIFPEAWRTPSVSPEGRALPEDQIERARSILSKGLAKYPPGVLEANLKTVYVLAELRYRDVITSGTNSRNCVYLKLGGEKAGFTATHVEGVFHAEFSSILLRNHPDFLDAKAWREANPAGFKYLGDGVEAVKQGKVGGRYREELLEKGFLSEYGCSTLENDFNGMAVRLFTGDASLWAVADQYPRIKRKLELALAFYGKLDPAFTEAFFRSQTKARELPKDENR